MKSLFFAVLLLFCPLVIARQDAPEVSNYGWIENKDEADKLAESLPKIYSEQLNKLSKFNDDQSSCYTYKFLFEALKKANQLTPEEIASGRLSSLNQQDVGSCVGYSTSQALDILMATDIYFRNEHEDWVKRVNADAIYGIGRLNNLGGWDGSTGAWSVNGISKVGTLHRLIYGDNKEFDLSTLNPKQGAKWARVGMDKILLKYASDHKVIACVRIENLEQAKAACQNRYPLITCAQASYALLRDDRGFSRRTGRNWAHAMAIIGYRSQDTGAEGYLIWNSWGDKWNSGGYFPEDMPMGSFWVTPQDLLFHIQQGDTWAIAGYEGFVAQSLDWIDVF